MSAPGVPTEELAKALGPDFLAYVCATEPAEFGDDASDPPLDPSRRRVFEQALGLARRFSSWRRPNPSNDDSEPPPAEKWEPLARAFGQFCELSPSGLTIADDIRIRAGGKVRTALELEPGERLASTVILA